MYSYRGLKNPQRTMKRSCRQTLPGLLTLPSGAGIICRPLECFTMKLCKKLFVQPLRIFDQLE